MLILAIETSTSRSSVCLASDNAIVAAASTGVPQRHGEFVAPAITSCLEVAETGVDAVSGVAVGLGPGLYTGLRVGIATAKAFAVALRLPVVGLCGLDVLAFQVRHSRYPVCVALDARRGELFWALYDAVPGGVQRRTGPTVGSVERLVGELEASGREWLVVGDAALLHAGALTRADVVLGGMGTAAPDATDLAELAVPRFLREDTQRADDLTPIYLRKTDARIGWEQRGRLRGGLSR